VYKSRHWTQHSRPALIMLVAGQSPAEAGAQNKRGAPPRREPAPYFVACQMSASMFNERRSHVVVVVVVEPPFVIVVACHLPPT
jgi:hypothetical protein